MMLLACGGSRGPDTPFSGDPLVSAIPAVITANFCKANASGNFVGPANLITEQGSKDGNFYAIGGGCINRPIREVWAAAQSGKGLKWSDPDLLYFKRVANEQVPFEFETKYEAGPFFHREWWIMQWFQSVTVGDVANPTHIIVNYQKTSGTQYITSWKGTFELEAIAPGVTAFSMENLIAGNVDVTNAVGGVKDIFSNMTTAPANWQFLNPTPDSLAYEHE